MAFTTQTKIHLNDAHVVTCLTDTLNLSGSTLFGTNAEYATGMTDNYNANTIPDVAFVTGLTSQGITDAENGLTKVSGDTVVLGGTLNTGATTTITIPDYTSTLQFVDGSTCLCINSESISMINTDLWQVTLDGGTNAVYLGAIGSAYGVLGESDGSVYFCSTGNSAIRISGGTVAICGTPILPNVNYNSTFVPAEDGILFRDADDNSVHLVTLETLISGATTTSITGATNGITKVGQDVVLGGALTGTTTINGGQTLNINQATVNLTGTSAVNITSPSVNLVTAPGAGDAADSILVRDASGVIQQVSFATVTGNTYSKACIDAYTGATDTRLDTIETTFITGGTEGLTKVGQDLCLGGELSEIGSGVISDSRTDTVGITYGGDYEADFVARSLVTAQYVTGLTNNSYTKAQIDSYTGATDIRLDIIEEDYVTGVTGGIYKTDCHTVSLTALNQAILVGALTGVTGTHLGTVGRDVCLDATAVIVIDNALTGSTNGLTDDDRTVKLGGTLTETTTITGAHEFSVNVNEINLTGATSGVSIGGTGLYIPATLAGTGNLLCIDSSTKKVGVTSLSAFGGITGGTNGVCDDGNYQLVLGGALCEDTTIAGAGYDLCLGTTASKLDVFAVNASGASTICGGTLGIFESGATFTDLRPTTGRTGIQYAADYSASFVSSSLVTKCYVDTVATGLHPHDVVLVATTGNIDLSGTETIDGIALVGGERVLVKNQTAEEDNGIYVVNSGGTWTRAEDFDGTPSGEVVNGDLIPVFTGATQANTIWVLTTPDPITVGTSDLVFTIFSRLLSVVAGDGIDVTPNGANQTVSVDLLTNGGLAICSTELAVADTIAGIGLSWTAGVLDVNAASGGVAGISVKYDGSDNLVVNAADISTAMGGVITGATNGVCEFAAGCVCLGGSITSAVNLDIQATGGLTITDSHLAGARTGIVYTADYSADYVCLSLVHAGYVTGLTDGLETRVENLETWSGETQPIIEALQTYTGVTNTRLSTIEADYVTGVTGTHLSKDGAHDICLDATAITVINGALTGATNGLDVVDRVVKLGGNLTEPTRILTDTTNNFCITNFNGTSCYVAILNGDPLTSEFGVGGGIDSVTRLQGGANCLVLSGGTAIYCDNNVTPTGIQYAADYSATYTPLSLITCKDLDAATSGITATALTGATNGLTVVGQDVVLGGALTGDTFINTDAGDLYVTGGTGFGLIAESTAVLLGDDLHYIYVSNTQSELFQDDGTQYSDLNVSPSSISFNTDNCIDASTEFNLTASAITVSSTYTDFAGIKYGADYSSDYTLRSLPDVDYVTGITSAICNAMLTGATNGLDTIGKDVILGGALTQDTLIDGVSSYSLRLDNLTGFTVGAPTGTILLAGNKVCLRGTDLVRIANQAATASIIIGTGSTVSILGTAVLSTPPASGDTASDMILVRDASTGAIQQIPATALGQNNNCYATTAITSSPVTLSTSHYAVFVDASGGSKTINLPASPTEGLSYKIKDCSGGALSNPITIQGGTIDGYSTALINTDYGALNLTYSNGKWYSMGFIN